MEFPGNATPVTPAAMAAAIVPAYTQRFGHAPDRETAELLLALLYLENDRGRAVIEHNWGNISTFARADVDYWRPPWFDLEQIEARPDSDPKKARYLDLHARMLAHKVPSAFRAFRDDQSGIRVWLANVKPTMYDAASSGDPMAFAFAYWSSGYCPDQSCKESGPTFGKLQDEIRKAGFFSALAPSKKAAPPVAAPGSQSSAPAAVPSSRLPPPPRLPSLSSGPPSGLRGVAPDMKRQLVIFAASCQQSNFRLMLENHDTAGVKALIKSYWADVLNQHPGPYPAHWCGAFALWCLHQAGLGLELSWVFGPPNYGFLYNLKHTKNPKPGDIAYLDQPWQHHAIVVEVIGESVMTIDGNQTAEEPVQTHEAPLKHWTAFYSIESLLSEAA